MRQFLHEELAPRQMVLTESKTTNPNCLGTMYGPCADYKNPTRNSNFYSRKLWENTFEDDIVKESLKDRILIGELDHPSDRLETKATNACIVMVDKEFHDDEGLLYGKFDILNTPNGRILKSLLDYGCKIGVSSRGEGDVEVLDEGGREVNAVDEDNYEFVAFDAVVLPAVKAAKPALQESLNHMSLSESLKKEVETATTTSELDLIKNVVESINLPESDSLLESVNNKSQELKKGTTSSSTLIEDLEQANGTIQELNEEISKLKGQLITYKSKYTKQISSRQKLVKESSSQKREFSDLNKEYNSLVFESNDLSQKFRNSELALSESKVEVRKLKESVSNLKDRIGSYQSQVVELEKSLNQSQDFSKSKIKEICTLKSQLESLQKKSDNQLNESLSKSGKLEESYRKVKFQLSESRKSLVNMRDSYINEKCKRLRLDSKEIYKSINSDLTDLKEVDKILESYAEKVQRYNSLPIVDDDLIDILQEGTVRFSSGQLREDKELEQTVKFMDEANKLF